MVISALNVWISSARMGCLYPTTCISDLSVDYPESASNLEIEMTAR